ncbi:MAG: polysaccharide biosynthesis protein [Holosporaceae bacterium]|jgi:FlaA1/EpsC-like NDP-sugar epimerase|nr:polysaccharide biosynthesis protein [Holosporaceae bacterium]
MYKNILKYLQEKTQNCRWFKKIKVTSMTYFREVLDYFFTYFQHIPRKYIYHMQYLLALVLLYAVLSAIIYPKFNGVVFLRELFALLCTYVAIFVWFFDRIEIELPHKIAAVVIICTAPMLFMHNAFSVAVVLILFMIFFEFVLFEYLRGCHLFASTTPVYVICHDEQDALFFKTYCKNYKILEMIIFADQVPSKQEFSRLASPQDLQKKLCRLNKIPFLPFPRRLIYFSSKINADILEQLVEISSFFSILLLKAQKKIVNEKDNEAIRVSLQPISLDDYENVNVSMQEKSNLTSVLKNKRLWICFDGRRSVLDFIRAISFVHSADLTIVCETEKLAVDVQRELGMNGNRGRCKAKVMDLDLMLKQNSHPDILFYNMPIKYACSSESCLTEVVVKNVLNMSRLIEFAQNRKIQYVFVLSSNGAVNPKDWSGATQRLGELFVQHADSNSRKFYTKFRIVRIPEVIGDPCGVCERMITALKQDGLINIGCGDFPLTNVYGRRNVLAILLKFLVFSMKNYDFSSSVYTIAPKRILSPEKLVKIICDLFSLRQHIDIPIILDKASEAADTGDYTNISETFENTEIGELFCTKFVSSHRESYENLWNIEEIGAMDTRELITAVFQSIDDKLKK